MENRKRNKKLGVWMTEKEKQIIKDIARSKGITVAELLLNWAKMEYEILEKETNK